MSDMKSDSTSFVSLCKNCYKKKILKKNIVLNLSDNFMFNTYDVVIKSTVTW